VCCGENEKGGKSSQIWKERASGPKGKVQGKEKATETNAEKEPFANETNIPARRRSPRGQEQPQKSKGASGIWHTRWRENAGGVESYQDGSFSSQNASKELIEAGGPQDQGATPVGKVVSLQKKGIRAGRETFTRQRAGCHEEHVFMMKIRGSSN